MKSTGMAALDEPLGDTAQGTHAQAAGRGRLTVNMLLHRVINKANVIKCYVKQAAKEMSTQ